MEGREEKEGREEREKVSDPVEGPGQGEVEEEIGECVDEKRSERADERRSTALQVPQCRYIQDSDTNRPGVSNPGPGWQATGVRTSRQAG